MDWPLREETRACLFLQGQRHAAQDELPPIQRIPKLEALARTAALSNTTDRFLKASSVLRCRTVTPWPVYRCWATHSPSPQSLRTSTRTMCSSCTSSPTCTTSGLKANTHLKGRCTPLPHVCTAHLQDCGPHPDIRAGLS